MNRLTMLVVPGLVMAAAAALAADKPGIAGREELGRCLAEGDRLEDERTAIEAEIRRLEAAQKDLQTLTRIHSANRARAVARDKAAIEAYNQKVSLLNSLAAALNGQSTDMMARQNEFNARIDASNERCAGMRVSVDDQEAVLLERVRHKAGK